MCRLTHLILCVVDITGKFNALKPNLVLNISYKLYLMNKFKKSKYLGNVMVHSE